MKVKNRSHKGSQKFDRIVVGRVLLQCFHFSDSIFNSVAYDPVKTRLSQSEAEVEKPRNHKARNQA